MNSSSSDIPADSVWQSPQAENIENLKQALEQRAATGEPMHGFHLVRADLESVNLVRANEKYGYQLTGADLYRANMHDAHCFMLDLSGSSLMKADFTHANLHYANLSNCNLLGTRFKNARIEQVTWGEQILQEQQARRATDKQQQLDLYQQAEEIYRNLRKTAEHQGLFETAGSFFQKEMTMRRMQMPPWSFKRILSRMVDLFCGYGERPLRVVTFSVIVILCFATLFFFSGLSFSGDTLAFDSRLGLVDNTRIYLSSLYFSVVTFTTLGYGDLAPVGFARALAALEAFLGSFTLALFVVVFVKKMTR